MKKSACVFSIMVLSFAVGNAQILDPVKWTYAVEKTGDKTYDLHITAFIDRNWHLYAQDSIESPRATTFNFMANPIVKLDGKVNESGELKNVYDPALRKTLNYYHGQVDFIQRVKKRSTAGTVIKGSVTYVVCNDIDKKCLRPKEVPFAISIEGK